jgi:hypothetical protein
MKAFSSAVFIGCLVLGGSAYAQESGQSKPPSQEKQENDTPKVSVTGCLTKGSAANEYLITDEKSGEKVPFSGPAQLDKYVNQTVKLTGTMATQGSDKVFKPQAINPVSPSCGKSQ